MPLVNMKEMLLHAYENGYATGAFDLINLDFLKGVLDAAERSAAPVILSLSESQVDSNDFELLMPAVEMAARKASVPVAIHLDHGRSLQSAVKAINRGCNGVMLGTSHIPQDDNIRSIRD
jgi:fructose-bisphosphate aldolase class II